MYFCAGSLFCSGRNRFARESGSVPMKPLTTEQLLDLIENRLPPAEEAAVRARLAVDPAAQAELQSLAELINLMRDDDSVDAPEYVIARAVRLIRPIAPAPAPNLFRRIVATLLRDSRQMPLAAGLRAAQTTPRSLAYSADEYELDVQIMSRAGFWQVRGQIFGADLAGVVTLANADQSVQAPINELGEFDMPPVAEGVYTLRVALPACEIVIERLELLP